MKYPPFILASYGWFLWLPIGIGGAALGALAVWLAWWWLLGVVLIVTLALLLFFRDPPRTVPNGPGIMVAPADGKVTLIETLDNFAPLGGPALKISIFLSVLDVHVNRMPCAGTITDIQRAAGLYLDARHPEASYKNQYLMLVINDPNDGQPLAAVKQIVGAIARRILTPARPGQLFARGERYGMIAFGSRTELIVPHPQQWEVLVKLDQKVTGGVTQMIRKRG